MDLNQLIILNWVIALQILSCFFMTGLIWVIQIIHYPSYNFIDSTSFSQFQKFHTHKITLIVAPIMIVEIATSLALFFLKPFSNLLVLNILLLFIIWISTAIFSVPTHNLLLKKFDLNKIKFLIKTNWIRTIIWTLRSLIWAVYIMKNIK